MKIVFISNFMNHHQLPFSKILLSMDNIEYWFVATESMPQERLNMGYCNMNQQYPFVLRAYEDCEQKEKALKLCEQADVAIIGSASIQYVKKRLKKKKLTYIYSERLYKKEISLLEIPLRLVRNYYRVGRHKSLFLLCASAYVAYDYKRTYNFINKAFKWGYFPEAKEYDSIEDLIMKKKSNSILWVGRLIDWKHPEIALIISSRLKSDGYEFKLNIIGTGTMESDLNEMVKKYNLEEYVEFIGAMTPEKVRGYMEEAQIFLFTSDRKEGWGAVLNEAMNSGCSVIANHVIGAAPFLIKDKENGMLYEDGNVEMLYNKVKYLLENPCERNEMAVKAYKTIVGSWNSGIAAERFIALSKELMEKREGTLLYKEGPCSKAEIIRDDWFN